MVYAGILSGGIGTRMQSPDMPKQYMELGDKPILIHTIDPFLIHPRIDEVIVAVPRPWVSYSIDLVRRHYPEQDKLHLIPGGETRNETLMCILEDIEARCGIRDEDMIISHDAIRPFVSERIINDNIDAVLKYGVVDTVMPANDTIVESTDGVQITGIPLWDHMYQGQTPQSFLPVDLRGGSAVLPRGAQPRGYEQEAAHGPHTRGDGHGALGRGWRFPAGGAASCPVGMTGLCRTMWPCRRRRRVFIMCSPSF